jgi:hypothetical protein
MKPIVHPGIFLGAVILFCTAWLSVRPPVSPTPTIARGAPRPTIVDPASIELALAILERYAGTYEGRGDFTIEVALKDGKLFLQGEGSIPTIPFELAATSETEFFLKGMGVGIEFDVARDGTVRGFAADTEYGLIEVTRVR